MRIARSLGSSALALIAAMAFAGCTSSEVDDTLVSGAAAQNEAPTNVKPCSFFTKSLESFSFVGNMDDGSMIDERGRLVFGKWGDEARLEFVIGEKSRSFPFIRPTIGCWGHDEYFRHVEGTTWKELPNECKIDIVQESFVTCHCTSSGCED